MISIICAILSLLATILIGIIQYIQGKRMEKLELWQDDENKKAKEQRIIADRNRFIMKYQEDDEIYMLPLCWVSAIYDPAHRYKRFMYMEYNMLEEDVQDAICQYMHFEIIKPNNDREAFYKDCVDALKKAEFKNYVGKQHKSIYYENAKYLRRTFDRYGAKELPIELDELEHRLTNLLCEYRKNPKDCPDPMTKFLEEYNYYACDEMPACELCAVLSKWLAVFDTDEVDENYWIPGEYRYESIYTMEDLFLCALYCTYLYLIMPKMKGNSNDQT